jgi:hypothetical protein
MTTPIQLGLPQLVLMLIVILALIMLVLSLIRLRIVRSVASIIIILVCVFTLWLSFSIQSYLGLTGDIKVATVRAVPFENVQHEISVHITLYDQYGNISTPEQTYAIKGDEWMLQGDILKFQPWLNVVGIHSSYKLTRLEGQYQDIALEQNNQHTVVALNGGDDDFFKSTYKQAWSSPFVEAAYGNAVILPANGHTYTVLVSQTGLHV